ncbi:S-layer homology domain-containing protein, partial [Paenibacillus oryzisoli]|uniref:InlB B-repeat-containing protein n=1 Tax=Paenibacillus oryzisoli TaxID=1850517 RepID=UPI003D2B371E
GDLNVSATFAIDTYTLNYTTDGNGTLTGTASQTVAYGADGTEITAVPNTGYHFVKWSDNVGTATRMATNVQGDASVIATFAINEYTLTYTAGANGTLTGTTPQSVNHGSDGTTVTAVADAGYHFVDWNDGVTTAERMDTNVQGALNVTANFSPDAHTLSYMAGPNGTLTGTDAQTVNHGSDGTAVTAVPHTGYHFVDWSDGLTTATRTDANVMADLNATANFAINEYTLTYTAGSNGTISGTLLQTVQHGSDGTTVTAVAYGGYHFVGWSDLKTTAVRTDVDIRGNLNVTANFAEDDQPAPSTPVIGGVANNGNKDVIVLVNGKAQNAGKANTTQVDNQTVTTISVNEKIIEEKIAQEGRNARITIPVSTGSDVVVGQLSGQILKKMEQSQATIEIATERASYTIPVQQLQLDKVISELGKQVNLQDLQLQITVAKPTEDMVGTVVKASGRGGFTLLVPPIEFEVKAVYGDQTIEITHFNAYVERTIALTEDIDPSKITTGIVVEPDGKVRHVPTKVVVIEGKYYAQVNSLTNSAYSIVWHPITFRDMTKHWAKDSVNDMGSRMVINGVADDTFAPDQDITRAEFAAVVVRALGLKLESGSAAFSDVGAADWYNEVIQTAYKYGLINGFEDGTFRPMDNITREQAAVIIAKAMSITALKNKLTALSPEQLSQAYQDGGNVSNWAVSGMIDCLASGIVTGRAEQTLAPKAFITRAEVAVMAQRLLQKSGLI